MNERFLALTASTLGLAMGLVLAEAAGQAWIRWHGLTPATLGRQHLAIDENYETDHPYLPYRMRPGADPGWLDINSLGSRGSEPEFPKQRLRVVTYGGSTTFGYPFRWSETWPGQLEALLGRDGYEVLNASISGATTADTLVNFALIHSDLEPDYLLVYHGTNDFAAASFPGFKSDYSHSRRDIGSIRFPGFLELPRWLDYSALFVLGRGFLIEYPGPGLFYRYQRPFARHDFSDPERGYRTFRRNLRHLGAMAESLGTVVVVGTFQFYKRHMVENWECQPCADAWEAGIARQNEIIRRQAMENERIELAEVARAFTPSEETMTDHVHLTAEGNRRVARAFYEAMIEAPDPRPRR